MGFIGGFWGGWEFMALAAQACMTWAALGDTEYTDLYGWIDQKLDGFLV
jgi:hypothetical protein